MATADSYNLCMATKKKTAASKKTASKYALSRSSMRKRLKKLEDILTNIDLFDITWNDLDGKLNGVMEEINSIVMEIDMKEGDPEDGSPYVW